MTGFTLYETLRIIVPGVMAVMIGALSLHLAGLGLPEPIAKPVTDLLTNPAVILGATLLIGLLLYAIDLPAKIRIQHEGDPERDKRIPSDTLRAHLPHLKDEHELGFYFLLSDRYLATETHKRVYLFGSLYRIFVDLRTLLMVGLTAGVLVRIASSYPSDRKLPSVPAGEYLLEAALAIVGVIAAGTYGLVQYNAAIRRKHQDKQSLWTRIGSELLRVKYVLLVISALAVSSVYSLTWIRGLVGILLASIAATLALVVWFWIEIGPPSLRGSTRDVALKRLGAKDAHTQYSPTQRLAADLSLIIPCLWAASLAADLLRSQPGTISLWTLIAVPASMILSFRKHEQRLLGIYEEQSVWLDYHKDDLADIERLRALPDRWT